MPDTYEITDDVPLPGPDEKYPFEKLAVGQSFLVPVEAGGNETVTHERMVGARRSVGVSMGRAAKRLTRTFEAHPVEGGVRVWRTA